MLPLAGPNLLLKFHNFLRLFGCVFPFSPKVTCAKLKLEKTREIRVLGLERTWSSTRKRMERKRVAWDRIIEGFGEVSIEKN